MAAQNLVVKAVVTPVLIGGASLAGRRFGHHVGGWLVGLPMTSGPVAFFLATDHGVPFAGSAAVGMMAATSSQVAFALAYRSAASRGVRAAAVAGSVAFALATLVLASLHAPTLVTFALVVATLILGYAVAVRRAPRQLSAHAVRPPRWDIPVRMLAATAVVILITTLAPIIGPHLAGLLSPFPVFGAVLAIFTHRAHGSAGAMQVLDGLLLGLLSAAVFFLVLATALPIVGLLAFAIAATVAIATQGLTVLAIPRDPESAARVAH